MAKRKNNTKIQTKTKDWVTWIPQRTESKLNITVMWNHKNKDWQKDIIS